MILSSLVLSVLVLPQSYTPPIELYRAAAPTIREYLSRTPTQCILFSWSEVGKYVNLTAQGRTSSVAAWSPLVRKKETVAYFMTAVAPKYSPTTGQNDTFYVVGVQSDAVTVIEKWKAILQKNIQGVITGITVTKTHVLSSAALTHVRAFAVAPSGTFAIIQNHETGDISKLDLTNGSVVPLLTHSAYPNLVNYDRIQWLVHETQGNAFLISRGRGHTHVTDVNSTLIMWDNDLDGIPNTVEELSGAAFANRGFDQTAVWKPLSFFNM